jgi:hypothetical protein
MQNQKRAFIRGLFGNRIIENKDKDASADKLNRALTRAVSNLNNDLSKVNERESSLNLEYTTYVFGKKNYETLQEMKIKNLRLLDNNPLPFESQYLLRKKI